MNKEACAIHKATMMFGHVETLEDRFEHLIKLRDVQAKKPNDAKGFLAFIPWTFQDVDTLLTKIRALKIDNSLIQTKFYLKAIFNGIVESR